MVESKSVLKRKAIQKAKPLKPPATPEPDCSSCDDTGYVCSNCGNADGACSCEDGPTLERCAECC